MAHSPTHKDPRNQTGFCNRQNVLGQPCTLKLERKVIYVKYLHLEIGISMVSCQKGPTRHAYAWQIGPFGQDTLDIFSFNYDLIDPLTSETLT